MATLPAESHADAPRAELGAPIDRRAELNNMKPTIASILGIQDLSTFDVLSSIRELYLVHYTPGPRNRRTDSQANIVSPRSMDARDVRGIIVDVATKMIVCSSFGYTPTSNVSELKPGEDGRYHLVDTDGIQHDLDPNRLTIKLGYEGTILRVFKHGGTVYHSTHRRIDSSRSRWGNSPSFKELYRQLKGPADEELFSPESTHSPYVYIFLLVHPSVLVVTKEKVGEGYIVYFGAKTMWEPTDTSPYPEGVLDLVPKAVIGENIRLAGNLTLEQANHHLQYGYSTAPTHPLGTQSHPLRGEAPSHSPELRSGEMSQSRFPGNEDVRLRPGEFVMLYHQNDDGGNDLLKVQGIPYWWRSTIRNNDPNLLHRFYQLVDWSYLHTESPAELNQFIGMFPLLNRISDPGRNPSHSEEVPPGNPSHSEEVPPGNPSHSEEVPGRNPSHSEEVPVSFSQRTDTRAVMTRDDRLHNIWQCYLMVVPLHCQAEVMAIYPQFLRDRDALIEWVRSLHDVLQQDTSNRPDVATAIPTVPEVPDVSERIITIVYSARQFAKERRRTHRNMSRNGHILGIRAMTRDNIRNLLMKEKGASLYRLVKEMKDHVSPSDQALP